MEQPGPAQRAQNLDIQVAVRGIEPAGILWLPIEHQPELMPGDAVLGFDVEYVQKGVPVAGEPFRNPPCLRGLLWLFDELQNAASPNSPKRVIFPFPDYLDRR